MLILAVCFFVRLLFFKHLLFRFRELSHKFEGKTSLIKNEIFWQLLRFAWDMGLSDCEAFKDGGLRFPQISQENCHRSPLDFCIEARILGLNFHSLDPSSRVFWKKRSNDKPHGHNFFGSSVGKGTSLRNRSPSWHPLIQPGDNAKVQYFPRSLIWETPPAIKPAKNGELSGKKKTAKKRPWHVWPQKDLLDGGGGFVFLLELLWHSLKPHVFLLKQSLSPRNTWEFDSIRCFRLR